MFTINPITKKRIKIGGPTYNSLVEKGIVFDVKIGDKSKKSAKKQGVQQLEIKPLDFSSTNLFLISGNGIGLKTSQALEFIKNSIQRDVMTNGTG